MLVTKATRLLPDSIDIKHTLGLLEAKTLAYRQKCVRHRMKRLPDFGASRESISFGKMICQVSLYNLSRIAHRPPVHLRPIPCESNRFHCGVIKRIATYGKATS